MRCAWTSQAAVDQVVDLQQPLLDYESLAHAQEGEAGGSVSVQGKDWIHINSSTSPTAS